MQPGQLAMQPMQTRKAVVRPATDVWQQCTRRQWLSRCAGGFGALALSVLWAEQGVGLEADEQRSQGKTHFAPRARSVIFLYMDGGVSQVDSFDPKPRLERDHGKPFAARIAPTQFDNIGTTLKSPWKFARHGESGIEVSELFPHVARHVDKMAVVRSMVSEFSEHNTANLFLHTGFGQQGRPSMGAWVGYGLGDEGRDLPGFVVINGGLIPSGGIANFASGFLPASYEATVFKPRKLPIANLRPPEGLSADTAGERRRLLERLDALAAQRYEGADAVESAIANYELAFRMQMAVPELADLEQESAATQAMYGLDSDYEPTRIFGRECLLARRMVERGVRFIELTCPRIDGNDRWDAHRNLVKNHSENARAVDQPIGALLGDLNDRGLLDETLVVWTGEFGRTPFAQGSDGRDHNPFGFSIWLAGGGIRGGTTYGATDEFGYHAIENKVTVHDLHATMLHLLGFDHKRLTFRFSGRDMRLTDVHGNVVQGILA